MEKTKQLYYKHLFVDHRDGIMSSEQNLFINFLKSSNSDVDQDWMQKTLMRQGLEENTSTWIQKAKDRLEEHETNNN